MLKKDVEVGGTYIVRWHDGTFTEVKLNSERQQGGYWATNLSTGRHVVIKSAAKLREKRPELTDAGMQWALANTDSKVALIALGRSSGWPLEFRYAAVNAVNKKALQVAA